MLNDNEQKNIPKKPGAVIVPMKPIVEIKTASVNDKALEEHLKNLPEEVRTTVLTFNWEQKMGDLGKKYGLRVDELNTVHFETLGTTVGLFHPGDLYENLKRNLGLDDETITNLVNDINENILGDLRRRIKALSGDKRNDDEEFAALATEEREDEILAKETTERLQKLPTEVQDILLRPDLSEQIGFLARKYKLDPMKFESIVSTVILCYLDPDNFKIEVASAFGLSEETAAALAKEAEEALWKNEKDIIKNVIQKETETEKVSSVLEKIEEERGGAGNAQKLDTLLAQKTANKMLEEKLKSKFKFGSATTSGGGARPITPPVGTGPVSGGGDLYRAKID